MRLIHMSKYSTISVPVQLHDELRSIVKEKPRLGYTSVAEFCKEAIRLHVSHIRLERRESILEQLNLNDLTKKIELLSATEGGIYRHIFEGLYDAVFYIDVKGKIINCNAMMVTQLGYGNKEELLNENISLIFANTSSSDALLEEIHKRGFVKDYEVDFKRKDGNRLKFLLSMGRVENNGKTIGYHGVGKDISSRKIAETRWKRDRDIYGKVLSELYDSVIVVQEGKIRFTGRVPLISGYTEGEVMDKNFLDFIAPEERKNADKIYKMLEEKRNVPSIVSTKLVSKEGKIIPIEASIRAIEFEGKKAALISLRDISKRDS